MRWRLAALLGVVLLAVGAGVARWRWPRAPQKDPTRLALLGSALSEFHAKHYDRATAILNRRAAEVAPTSLDWMLRARIAEAQGLLAEAIDDLKHIPDSDEISSQAWLKAGQVEVAQNVRGRPRRRTAAHWRSIPSSSRPIASWPTFSHSSAARPSVTPNSGRWPGASRWVTSWPSPGARTIASLWDPKEAIPILSRFIATDPTDRVSRLALASCYETSNQLDLAAAALSPLPESDPDARALRITLAIDRGEIEIAGKLARDGPSEHLRLNVCRGKLAFASDASQAAAYYRSALRQDPEDRDALHGLGVALRKLGDPKAGEYLDLAALHDKLRRTIQDSVTTIQTDLKLFSKLGGICESLHRLEEARIWYQLAIERDPLDVPSQQALSRVGK